ncbi:alpha/beta fold hydrolase [Herbiconiux sp. KACC 21604]|uniref:alpha/beta fold hydrolase n=1 Tax=unclassified Herbiconiux TaxID=2618217 RepID=UPI0014913DA7|nr:alpha/beta fold hydrolase [Herbiconiux sp. SALV-R1]QJU54157.1 alpha/beta fold hydrolase [Herbiconiux sp. SALV-R1]WPO85210.1 alpha/beta fold hydrolase [Herbiconiux sp. KACC 21604]
MSAETATGTATTVTDAAAAAGASVTPAALPTEFEHYPLRTTRRGHFWVAGERVPGERGTVQRAPLFVEWEAPAEITRPYPLVLVHGGGGQITDWRGTPDGRPGWADKFVDAGYLVYLVDRPAHGRSWAHPDVVGAPGAQFSYEMAMGLFDTDIPGHDQSLWSGGIGDPGLDQLTAGMGFLLADLAESHRMDQDRISRLLDRIGPAVLVTHSAGGPTGWLVADARPELVKAHVAIEPMGPPFHEFGPGSRLDWGLAAAPLRYEPEVTDPAELEASPGSHRLPALEGLPVVVVVGETSPFTAWAPLMVEYVNAAGGSAEFLNLGDAGVHGNGHAMMLEKNSDAAVVPILDWIARIR